MKRLIVLFGILALVMGCQKTVRKPEVLYKAYCGSCHTLPNPKELPKSVWKEKVLPEMAARLGYQVDEYDPYRGLSFEEREELIKIGTYPQTASINEEHWKVVSNYILALAPDSLSSAKRLTRSRELVQFSSKVVPLDGNGAFITFLGFSNGKNQLFVGDFYGQLWQVDSDMKPQLRYIGENPIIDYSEESEGQYITEIGIMQPSQIKAGKLIFKNFGTGESNAIADQLHRPVKTIIADLNQDNQKEIIISEFGDKTGNLTLMVKDSLGKYQRRNLLNAPGVSRVMLQDMNKDGLTDLVALAGQESEGVYILYQKEDLRFVWERVISFSPVYGTNWMDLADYNNDGFIDVFVVQGDNADFSMVSKPYHGVRIFINDGQNNFQEKYFYPVYGATRVIAQDFDQDRDLDLAVSSFFPDYNLAPEESFVYLENKNPEKYEFVAYSVLQAKSGRWLTMEAGDYDNDGDIDLALGSFTYPFGSKEEVYQKAWSKTNVDLLLLQNNLVK